MPGTGRCETFGMTRCLSVSSVSYEYIGNFIVGSLEPTRSDRFLRKQVLHGIQCEHTKSVNRHVHITYSIILLHYMKYAFLASHIRPSSQNDAADKMFSLLEKTSNSHKSDRKFVTSEEKTPYSHLWPVYSKQILWTAQSFKHLLNLSLSM